MDISSLLSSLSEDDIQKLKNTASQIFGESTSREETENKQADFSKNSPFAGFNGIDANMLGSVAKFSSMLSEPDDRCNFILALKPLLSENRRNKADDAVMMLKFMKIISAMQENGR